MSQKEADELGLILGASMKKSSVKPSQLLQHLDVPALRDAAAHLIAEGHTQAEVIAEVVQLIDVAIPWALIIPGPAGVVVEALDGPVATFLATSIVRVAIAVRENKKGAGASPKSAVVSP